MRAFGLIGLVIALAIMGLLVKKQMRAAPAAANAPGAEALLTPDQNGRESLSRLKDQAKKNAEKAMKDRAKKALDAGEGQ